LLAQTCQFPMNSPRSSSICLAIMANREYVISELEKVMFTPQGKLKASLSFCLEIEHLLYWHFIFHKQQDEIARPLYEKITKDVLYEKFSRFVHDDSLKYEIGSGEQEKQNRIDVASYIEFVSESTLSKAEKELNLFATEVGVIGEWKFRNLQALLERLGAKKPELAFNLLHDALKANKPLSNQMFLAFLLRGIRISGKYEIWDKVVWLIIKTKKSNFIGSIPASLHVYADVFFEPVLRKEDLIILTNLANRSGSFEFLKTGKQSFNINYVTINALRAVYSLNPKKIEDLIVVEIKSGPSFLENYLNTLSIYAGRENGIDFGKWSIKNKKFLAEKIIEVPVIDWHIESLINNLYSNPIDIVQIFIARIKKEAKLRKSMSDYFDRSNRYDAIPFHMNDHLVEYVVTHKDYIKIVPEIIKASKSRDGSKRKYDFAKLNQHFRISASSILETLTAEQKVTDKILKNGAKGFIVVNFTV